MPSKVSHGICNDFFFQQELFSYFSMECLDVILLFRQFLGGKQI